jgi:hypothetical protein
MLIIKKNYKNVNLVYDKFKLIYVISFINFNVIFFIPKKKYVEGLEDTDE